MNPLDEFSVLPPVTGASPAPGFAVNLSSSTRLRYLIDNTPAIIDSSVPAGNFRMTFVCNNAHRVLGYYPEEMLADRHFRFNHVHSDVVPQIFSTIAKLFTEVERTYEYRFRSRTGQYLWMHDMLRLIREHDGTPVEAIGSLTDITKHMGMEKDLLKMDEEQKLIIKELQEARESIKDALCDQRKRCDQNFSEPRQLTVELTLACHFLTGSSRIMLVELILTVHRVKALALQSDYLCGRQTQAKMNCQLAKCSLLPA